MPSTTLELVTVPERDASGTTMRGATCDIPSFLPRLLSSSLRHSFLNISYNLLDIASRTFRATMTNSAVIHQQFHNKVYYNLIVFLRLIMMASLRLGVSGQWSVGDLLCRLYPILHERSKEQTNKRSKLSDQAIEDETGSQAALLYINDLIGLLKSKVAVMVRRPDTEQWHLSSFAEHYPSVFGVNAPCLLLSPYGPPHQFEKLKHRPDPSMLLPDGMMTWTDEQCLNILAMGRKAGHPEYYHPSKAKVHHECLVPVSSEHSQATINQLCPNLVFSPHILGCGGCNAFAYVIGWVLLLRDPLPSRPDNKHCHATFPQGRVMDRVRQECTFTRYSYGDTLLFLPSVLKMSDVAANELRLLDAAASHLDVWTLNDGFNWTSFEFDVLGSWFTELLQIPFPEEKFLSFKQTDTIGAIGPGQGGAIRYTRKVMTGDLENALHGCDTEARKMSRR